MPKAQARLQRRVPGASLQATRAEDEKVVVQVMPTRWVVKSPSGRRELGYVTKINDDQFQGYVKRAWPGLGYRKVGPPFKKLEVAMDYVRQQAH